MFYPWKSSSRLKHDLRTPDFRDGRTIPGTDGHPISGRTDDSRDGRKYHSYLLLVLIIFTYFVFFLQLLQEKLPEKN